MASPTIEADASPSASGRSPIFYGYWLIGAAFTAQFISAGMQNYVIGAFLKPMTTELDWSRSEFVLARTIGQFVVAFTGLYIGGVVDRRGGKWLMRGGICVLSAALFGCSFVQEQWQWILLNGLILTVGASMVGNLVVNVTLAKWFVEKRGRAAGFAAMGVSFAGIVITPGTAELVAIFGWREAWQILAVLAFIIIMPVSFIMRRAPEDHGLHPDGKTAAEVAAGGGARAAADFASSVTRAQALRTPAFYLVVLAFGLGAISIGVMLVQTIPYMTDAGYSTAVGAAMITVASVPSMLLKPVWGYFIDKADAQRLSVIGFAISAVSMVLIVVGVRAGISPLAFFGFFLLGCGWSGLIPLQEVVWASFFGRRYLGAVRSAGLPFSLGISASAPLLASFYFDRIGNYDGAFLAIAGCAVLAIVLISFARPPVRTAAAA